MPRATAFRIEAYKPTPGEGQTTLTFDLTHFRRVLLVFEETKIDAFSEDYQQPVETTTRLRTVAAYPRVACCDRFSYQQVVHILLQHERILQMNSIRLEAREPA